MLDREEQQDQLVATLGNAITSLRHALIAVARAGQYNAGIDQTIIQYVEEARYDAYNSRPSSTN